MIITIDGLSGAGKTTQAHNLSQLLGIPHVSTDSPSLIMREVCWAYTHNHGDHHFVSLLRNLLLFRFMQEGDRGWGQDFICADNFFRMLTRFYRKPERDEYLSFFRRCLTMDAGQEPVASFYLHVLASERELRRIYREQQKYNTFKFEDLKISTAHNSDDADFREFFQWLQERVPYIHIIDGAQPEEKVTADMMKILKDKGYA